MFPYDYRFRTTQAHTLYRLSFITPELVPVAIISVRHALRADPLAADLTLALFDLETRASGPNVKALGERLKWLAPNATAVQKMLKERGF